MLDITEKRLEIYARDNYKCQYPDCDVTGCDNIELAHRISKGKNSVNWVRSEIRRKFDVDLSDVKITDILNHPINLKTSCRKHNDYFNIGNKPEKAKLLLIDIYYTIYAKNLNEG